MYYPQQRRGKAIPNSSGFGFHEPSFSSGEENASQSDGEVRRLSGRVARTNIDTSVRRRHPYQRIASAPQAEVRTVRRIPAAVAASVLPNLPIEEPFLPSRLIGEDEAPGEAQGESRQEPRQESRHIAGGEGEGEAMFEFIHDSFATQLVDPVQNLPLYGSAEEDDAIPISAEDVKRMQQAISFPIESAPLIPEDWGPVDDVNDQMCLCKLKSKASHMDLKLLMEAADRVGNPGGLFDGCMDVVDIYNRKFKVETKGIILTPRGVRKCIKHHRRLSPAQDVAFTLADHRQLEEDILKVVKVKDPISNKTELNFAMVKEYLKVVASHGKLLSLTLKVQ